MKNFFILFGLLSCMQAASAFADEAKVSMDSKAAKKVWTLTPEQRQSAAKMHEQMAECLRSNKPLNECRDIMHKGCKDLGKEGCPMMGECCGGEMHHKS